MDFKTKIDKVLKLKKLALWKLAEEADLASTLRKAYKQNREMRPSTTEKFLEALKISEKWWNSGQGEVFISFNTEDMPHLKAVQQVMNGRYDLPPAIDQWVHKKTYEALEANLVETKARLDEAQAKINELDRLHAQHNEQMKAMLELANELAKKAKK
jgi:hypothetical protein